MYANTYTGDYQNEDESGVGPQRMNFRQTPRDKVAEIKRIAKTLPKKDKTKKANKPEKSKDMSKFFSKINWTVIFTVIVTLAVVAAFVGTYLAGMQQQKKIDDQTLAQLKSVTQLKQ